MPFFVPKDAFKTYTRDQDKAVSPEKTVRAFVHKAGALDLELFSRTTRIDPGRLGIPVYFAEYGAEGAQLTGKRRQMGKGATPAQAEASAVMELAERFSLYAFGQDPANFMTGPHSEMTDPLPLWALARSVDDETETGEKALEVLGRLPLRWCRGTALHRSTPILVPFDWFWAINQFNGSCAGNVAEEALVQGLCEVIERHVSCRVARERIPVPSVSLKSLADPVARDLVGRFTAAGIVVHLFDFSLDTGVPTVSAAAWDPATVGKTTEIVWTAGTATHPEKAAIRALTEVAQLAGDFLPGAAYLASGLPKPRDLSELDFLLNASGRKDAAELPDVSDNNFKLEIQRLAAAMHTTGWLPLAVETTHPGLMIPAFYTTGCGARFRERAQNASVGLFTAKLIVEGFDTDQARSWLAELESVVGETYYIPFYRGTLAYQAGYGQTARAEFDTALAAGPPDEDAYSILFYQGCLFRDLEDIDRAEKALEKAVALDPDRTEAHNLLGYCHFVKKEHREAIACFERVLEIDPGSAIDHANIGSNYRDLGDKERAVEYYKKALELDPSLDFARENLARLLE